MKSNTTCIIDINDLKNSLNIYSFSFFINKTPTLGRLIGMKLHESDIPQIYKDVILKAKSLC